MPEEFQGDAGAAVSGFRLLLQPRLPRGDQGGLGHGEQPVDDGQQDDQQDLEEVVHVRGFSNRGRAGSGTGRAGPRGEATGRAARQWCGSRSGPQAGAAPVANARSEAAPPPRAQRVTRTLRMRCPVTSATVSCSLPRATRSPGSGIAPS